MRFLPPVGALVLVAWGVSVAAAQFDRPAPAASPFGQEGVKLAEPVTQKWEVGVTVTARGPVRGILATIPVPTDWPEQRVQIASENFTPHVGRVGYRELEGGVKQMLVSIPQLPAGETAHALVTFEVTRSPILAPADPSVFVIPQRVPREVRKFLGASPYIESTHGEIRKKADEVIDDSLPAWQQVEAAYDWVRDNVTYDNGKLKGALAALRDGNGDCEELTSLFIALCRAKKIPARTVWIPDHCYPEFYLEDAEGNGHWIPCEAAGTRSFGAMATGKPVLQKGDNFRVPEKREPQRYVAELLKATSVAGAPPTVVWHRRLIEE